MNVQCNLKNQKKKTYLPANVEEKRMKTRKKKSTPNDFFPKKISAIKF